ncbi:NAD(P)-binding protein [Ramaria rubella]|nr:NAD(P)-binding protein [Ramaria rubella]
MTSFNPAEDLPDLNGRVIIVTGGSGGLGLAIVKHLAGKGAKKVYMAVRDDDQTKEAFVRLKYAGIPDGAVHFLELDLVTAGTARESAEKFMTMENRLDVLGHIIGPLVFTQTLLPLLRRTAEQSDFDVRIVNVGSDGHYYVKNPRYDTLEAWNNKFPRNTLPSQSRYLYSKMGVHLWSNGLIRRMEGSNITVMIIHPGPVFSDGAIAALRTKPLSFLTVKIASFFLKDPMIAAYSSVFAAGSNEIRLHPEKYRGAYIKPPNIIGEQSPVAMDIKRQDELWTFVENHLSSIGQPI